MIADTLPGGNTKPVDIILVHGLFIGPWAWKRVKAQLEDEFTVYTPHLPFVSLEGDAAVVRQQVSASVEAGHAVLLIGHSYGGMVVSEAGHEATNLAYLAALAPEPGETTAQISLECVTAVCTNAMVPSEDGSTVSLDGPKSIDAWYHLCSEEDTEFGIARHRSAPAAIFDEPVNDPAWRHRPSTYIVCSEDHSVTIDYQRSRGALMKGTEAIVADHSGFFSATNELSTIIAALARACAVDA